MVPALRWRGDLTALVVTVVGALLVFAFASSGVLAMTLGIAAVAAAMCAVAATRAPAVALGVGVALVAVVPIYWSPDLPGTQIGVYPVSIVAAVLSLTALRAETRVKLGLLDRLVAMFLVFRVVSLLLNAPNPTGPLLDTVLTIAAPYVVVRVLGQRPDAARGAAVGVVVAGVIAAAVAIRETSGVANPYFERFTSGHQHAFHARADTRFGQLRPEASFGHALALGMFLVFAAVLALALAWTARRLLARSAAVASALLILWALVQTLVRGPLLMLVFAILVLLASEVRRGRWMPILTVVAVAIALASIGAFGTVAALREASFQDQSVRESGEYRLEIWEVVKDPGNFSWFGREVVDEERGLTQAIGESVGLKSFDNAYALLYIGFGAAAVLVFTFIGLTVARSALRRDLSLIDRAWVAVVFAAFVNVMTVDLLTQFAHIFWMAIGLIAAAQHRSAPVADAAELEAVDASA